MDILKIAINSLAGKVAGSNASSDNIRDIVAKLVGSGDSLDLEGFVNDLKVKGFANLAESWLGDGDNQPISEDQVKGVLGQSKIAEAAQSLGINEGELLSNLKDILPQIVDKSSKGGSLLGSITDIASRFR